MAERATTTPEIYAMVRDELIAGIASAGDGIAERLVPACPAWSVKDVVAHLTGLNAEFLAGLTGLGSDEATTRQVTSRASMTMAEITAEWSSLGAEITERFATNENMASALLADLVVHVYDLVEVVEQSTAEATKATPMSAHRYVPLLQQRLAEELNLALTIDLSDGTSWPADAVEGSSVMTMRTDPHNFLRGVTGRLTRAQVEAFDWSADPASILDNAWNQYGPFRAE